MVRTYDRLASPPECAATSNAGDGVIGAKDRPGNLTGASDQEVVAWANRGHDAAFRELVRRYERPVFSLLYRMVRNRGLAEDLAQETFIKVLNGLGSYNPQYRFSSWIFKIANNAAIDHAIAKLRPEYRACVLLRHVEGHSYEEIARILDLPLGTVKTYIHRARNELRGYLEDRRE